MGGVSLQKEIEDKQQTSPFVVGSLDGVCQNSGSVCKKIQIAES